MDNDFPQVKELHKAFRDGSTTPEEATETALARIELLQPHLNAFQHIAADTARADAQAATERWQAGNPIGPFDGIPLTIKDTLAVRGMPTRVGSQTTSAASSDADAPPAARLREAGAVILGKTTTPEFGWKGMTDSPLAGITRNPWNLAHTPGGSSGGAAAALAAGIGAIAHGSDGGGSIRIPSSYCGLYGIKPSFGRVPTSPNESLYGVVISNGPIARSVTDAALMLNELKKPDHRDFRALPYDARDYTIGLDDGIRGWRIAYAPELGSTEISPEVRQIVDDAVGLCRDLGASVETVGPVIDPLRPQFEEYWLAGFASRIRDMDDATRALLDPRFRDLAEKGLSVGTAAVERAETARINLGRRFNELFTSFDLLLTPTMPSTPPTVETSYHSNAFDRWRDAVPFTLPFNLTGLPAANLPIAVSGAGLPIGLQIVARQFADHSVLRASRALEAGLNRPTRHPDLDQIVDGRNI